MSLLLLLTTSSMAGDLASSFKEAAALAGTEDKDRATRIYADIDLTTTINRNICLSFSLA
jgi:hypothetical protein